MSKIQLYFDFIDRVNCNTYLPGGIYSNTAFHQGMHRQGEGRES